MNFNEDYVEDSEEELSMDAGLVNAISNWTSENANRSDENIAGETENQNPDALHRLSSISDFTAQTGGEASTAISTFTTPAGKPPRPRPRPIPKKKKTDGNSVDSSSISTFSFLDHGLEKTTEVPEESFQLRGDSDIPDFSTMSSIADRAKTRQRKTQEPYSAPVWDEEDFDLPQVPKKKKSREGMEGAKSTKGKEKAKTSVVSDIIELTDDEDELNLPKPKKTKKPKPKARSPESVQAHTTTDTASKPPRPKPKPKPKKPRLSTDEHTFDQTPEGLAPAPANAPVDAILSSANGPRVPSSLPPSDPPPTSQNSASTSGMPGIAVLTEASGSRYASVGFGSTAGHGRKPSSQIDELFSGDEDLFGPEPPAPVSDNGIPPPTFFASSSTSSQIPNDRSPARSKGPEAEVMDLTMLPTAPQAQETPAPPKSKRKKKAVDEDENDDDWGEAPSKAKEKKPKAPRKKKSAKDLPQVQVVIETTPESILKEKKKRKGKDKDKGNEAKEVFKSREMIEDSDEDPLSISYRPGEIPGAGPSSGAATTSPGRQRYSGALGSESGPPPVTGSAGPQDVDMVDDDDDFPVVSKSNRKKRKTLAVEDEDEDFGEAPAEKDSPPKKKKKAKEGRAKDGDDATTVKRSKGKKAKAVAVVSEGEGEEPERQAFVPEEEDVVQPDDSTKENVEPAEPSPPQPPKPAEPEVNTPQPPKDRPRGPRPSISSRVKATPMSELIKRVNSLPNSPFPAPSNPRVSTISKIATSYSPYLKSSKSLLSKIAPLHPNRRTPPPPLPPPPPKKKTKKELEREERWEEEIIDSVGIEAWAAMSDIERRDMRKAKMEAEMGGWD